LKRKATCSCGF